VAGRRRSRIREGEVVGVVGVGMGMGMGTVMGTTRIREAARIERLRSAA